MGIHLSFVDLLSGQIENAGAHGQVVPIYDFCEYQLRLPEPS